MSQREAKINWWRKEIAPSTALRKWFAHDPARWLEFRCHYFTDSMSSMDCANFAPAKIVSKPSI